MKRYLIAAALFLAFGGASFADTVAWDVTQTHNFGTLDLTTGQFNQVSNFGFTPAGIGEIGGSHPVYHRRLVGLPCSRSIKLPAH